MPEEKFNINKMNKDSNKQIKTNQDVKTVRPIIKPEISYYDKNQKKKK